jgi:hypothetical protein
MLREFLRFLDADILRRPECVKPIDEALLGEARQLTKDTKVDDNESLPDDVTL